MKSYRFWSIKFGLFSTLFLTHSIFASYCIFDLDNEFNDNCSLQFANNSDTYYARCTVDYDKLTTTVDPYTFSLHKQVPITTSVSTGTQIVKPLSVSCKFYNKRSNLLVGSCLLNEIDIRAYGLVPILAPKCTSTRILMTESTSNITRGDVVSSQVIINLGGS